MIGDLQYIYISQPVCYQYVYTNPALSGRICVQPIHAIQCCRPRPFLVYLSYSSICRTGPGDAHLKPRRSTHTHRYIYIYTYIYTPWEPLKPSFLGLSAHISRAEKRSFFMGFGVQRHIHGETWCVCGLFHPSSHKVKNSSQDKDHQAGPDSGTCVLCMYYKAHSE